MIQLENQNKLVKKFNQLDGLSLNNYWPLRRIMGPENPFEELPIDNYIRMLERFQTVIFHILK